MAFCLTLIYLEFAIARQNSDVWAYFELFGLQLEPSFMTSKLDNFVKGGKFSWRKLITPACMKIMTLPSVQSCTKYEEKEWRVGRILYQIWKLSTSARGSFVDGRRMYRLKVSVEIHLVCGNMDMLRNKELIKMEL